MNENDWKTILNSLGYTAKCFSLYELEVGSDDAQDRDRCMHDIAVAHNKVLEESGLPVEASPMRCHMITVPPKGSMN